MSKILVVEDDLDTRQSLKDWLKHERFEVEAAEDGRSAVDILTVSNFDVIILDWDLPYLSGIEVCKWLRERGNSTAVLFLTGKSDGAEIDFGLNCGADDYVTKPFRLSEITARIRALLRRPRTTIADVLKMGNITMEIQTHKVYKDEQLVELQPKEFALLELLMKHPNDVFTTDALIKRIWKTGDEVTDLSVRNCVRKLRLKLGQEIISNSYGVGYQINLQAK